MKAQLSLEFMTVLLLLMFAAAGAIKFSLDFRDKLDIQLASLSDEVAVEALAIELSSSAAIGRPSSENSLYLPKGVRVEDGVLILRQANATPVGFSDSWSFENAEGTDITIQTYNIRQ